MAKRSQTYDVFISYASVDTDTAGIVAAHLSRGGFAVFVPYSMTSTSPSGYDSLVDTLWEALAESEALVAIFSGESSSTAQGLEIGAAIAWHKPIYVVSATSSPKIPRMIERYAIYPLSRLDDVARAIRMGSTPLTDDELNILVRAYRQVGISSDQLSGNPDALEKLRHLFSKEAGRDCSGERLLREIMRLRKSNKWTRLQKTSELTPAERQVLRLVLDGCTTREIALRLHRSPRTVEIHRMNMLRKLSVSTNADLFRYLAQETPPE
jgi:DNA-binding CsgD family transcriptional regulator